MPGYAASKLGAWLDRAEWLEAKDATDLSLAMHWYAESTTIQDRLYATSAGNDVLVVEAADVGRAAAHLLGIGIANGIGDDQT